MPRNGSGTYTLPQPAFVTNTVISSVAVNSDFSDIASALTASIAADGQTPITDPIEFNNGTAALPGVTFAGDDTTGIYLPTSGELGISCGGAVEATFTASAFTFNPNSTFNNALTISGGLTLNGTSYTFGAGAANAWWNGMQSNVDIGVVFDGGGAVLTATKIYMHIPFSMTIFAWRVIADQAGSVTIDIQRAHNTIPTSSIVGGGNAPNLSGGQIQAQGVVGWSATTLVDDDYIAFAVTGTPSGVTRVTVQLSCNRTSNT